MPLRHHYADHLRTCTVACPFLLTSVSLRFSFFLSESFCEVCQVAFPRCVDDIAGEVAHVLKNGILISHLRCAIGFLYIHSPFGRLTLCSPRRAYVLPFGLIIAGRRVWCCSVSSSLRYGGTPWGMLRGELGAACHFPSNCVFEHS